MSSYQARIADLVERDPRYAYEAYEFVFAALSHTQKHLGRLPARQDTPDGQHHVSGRELVEGVRELALSEFGLMARIVFRMWGVTCTSDFGEIVFNLVAEGLMSKTDQDTREEFQDIFDFDRALVEDYRIELDELEWTR